MVHNSKLIYNFAILNVSNFPFPTLEKNRTALAKNPNFFWISCGVLVDFR